MNQPAVSIVMPVYNDETTLTACLNSIWKQTFHDFELVVVDDGSNDSTPELLGNQNDSRLIVVSIEKNGGIVNALNAGLSQCHGTLIARMDGDDLMRPDRLEKQVHFMETNPHVDLCGSLVALFCEAGTLSANALKYMNWSNQLQSHEDICASIFMESPIMHPTFLGRRELFESLKGYEDHGWAEDYDFLLRAFLAGSKFGKIPEVLVDKRDSPERLSRVRAEYKRPAMFNAKVHYLLQSGLVSQDHYPVIFGTGPSGRELARSLIASGIAVQRFVDNLQGPPDRTVMGIPASHQQEPIASWMPEDKHRVRILLALSSESIELIKSELRKQGLQENREYFQMI
ncbi:MAG: glycosyltransferase [SAR324 cluster bacterium]|nr:glycosyltransferase [SAR324 cluster bacterium]